MNVQICTDTDPGLARGNNEDSVAFDTEAGLCILADGMGGHNAGEVASGMATAFIKSEMRKQIAKAGNSMQSDDIMDAMSECVTMANQAIFSMSRTNPQYKGMGTTLVLGVFHDDTLVLGHIGDSRCYRLRDGQLLQITKDHSVLQEQIDAGLDISTQDIVPNLLTRGLGTESFVETEINLHTIAMGDIYLMCSDGLSDMINEVQIASILSMSNSLEVKAKQLIAAANAAGGKDNISVVLAQVGSVVKKPKLLRSAGRAMRNALSGLRRS
ncbi:MAG: PP2C family protein-serine/threonine phosphatase [Burkholderiaceae bacterium]